MGATKSHCETSLHGWTVSTSRVSKRSWHAEIIQDHLEEAEEMFEVLLVSPEGTVISSIHTAQVTIRESGGRGGCQLTHDREPPVLGGKEIRSDTYPQHGSIQLEKLPLGTDSVIWTRGDSVSRPVPKKKLKVRADNTMPKPCVPELIGLLHFNQTTNQLFHCNGVSWKPWAPTDQMVSAQTCPQGWTFHRGHCYTLSTEHKVTWSTANRACRERYKGTLVSVLSKVDMDWLWDFSGRKPFWIGLNDREGRGRWEWAGGEPVSYTNWRKTPPRSKMKGNKKCVLVWRRAKWQIRDCKMSRGHRFVCSVKT
ncbi:FRAS1-related extracellular matrix protein 1-like [Pagrus major]|uniref:FRAS1-related extracellular matrix protein 1-like n=1 Tax=Pagrus major TaxID=143350 RepID=UPI003CC85A6A